MKKFIYFILAATLTLVTACNKDGETVDTELNGRTFTIEAVMPDIPHPGTRMVFDYDDGGLNNTNDIEFEWEQTDKIYLAFKQGETVKTLATPATITNIAADKKTCTFEFTTPDGFGINFEQAYTVYGIVGGATFTSNSTEITMNNVGTEVFDLTNNKENIVLGFSKDMTSGTHIGRNKFYHIGTFLLINLHNLNPADLTLSEVRLESRDNPAQNWFHGGTVKYDMATNSVTSSTQMSTAKFKTSSPVTIPKLTGMHGFWQWVVPFKDYSTTDAHVRVSFNYNGNPLTSDLTSKVNLQTGRYYRINRNWDATMGGLYYTKFCTSLPAGGQVHIKGIFITSGAGWIDVVADGKNGTGDIVFTNGGNENVYVPANHPAGKPYCFYIYGEITGIRLDNSGGGNASKIVSAVTNNPHLKDLELSYNTLDAAALKSMLESLPDRTGEVQGKINLYSNSPALTTVVNQAMPGQNGLTYQQYANSKNWTIVFQKDPIIK